MLSRRKPQVYPDLWIQNLTNSTLYLGIEGRNVRGVWLAPTGSSGDSVVVHDVDLTKKAVNDTLKNYYDTGKISIKVIGGLHQQIGAENAIPTTLFA